MGRWGWQGEGVSSQEAGPQMGLVYQEACFSCSRSMRALKCGSHVKCAAAGCHAAASHCCLELTLLARRARVEQVGEGAGCHAGTAAQLGGQAGLHSAAGGARVAQGAGGSEVHEDERSVRSAVLLPGDDGRLCGGWRAGGGTQAPEWRRAAEVQHRGRRASRHVPCCTGGGGGGTC